MSYIELKISVHVPCASMLWVNAVAGSRTIITDVKTSIRT